MKTKKTLFIVIGIIGMVLIACLIVGNILGSLAAIKFLVNVVFFSFTVFGVYIFFYEEWYLVLFERMGIYVHMRPEMAAIVRNSRHYQVIERPFSKGFFVWPSDEVTFVSKALIHIEVPMQVVYENRGIEASVISSDALRESSEALSNTAEYDSLQEYFSSDESFKRKKEKMEAILREYFASKNSDKVDYEEIRKIVENNLLFPNLTLVNMSFNRVV